MSIYLNRFSMFPRHVTMEDVHAGDTYQLGYLGQPPTTRDVVNSYPMPIYPSRQWGEGYGYLEHPTSSRSHHHGSGGNIIPWPEQHQLPGPFVGRDLPPHLYPPRTWENIDQFAYAPVPAIGSTVTILSFIVPIGRNGIINKVANNFIGGGWIAGTGDIVWRILVDGAPPPGATSYNNITDSLGSQAQPVGISGFRIFENQHVTVVAFNNPGGLNGGVIVSGQQVGARLMGHLYPRDMEYLDLWV